MHNYLNYRPLKKIFFLLIFIGALNTAQGQTDSLLQTLLVDEKIDSQLIAPKKMLKFGFAALIVMSAMFLAPLVGVVESLKSNIKPLVGVILLVV